MKQFVVAALLLAATVGHAQVYKPFTNQRDSFSIALVALLNCAAEEFTSCKGDSLRSTWLLGDDYRLTVSFPQSAAGVVRIRDWDKNAYVEFSGFKNEIEARKGLQKLASKIKAALAGQVLSHDKDPGLFRFFSIGNKSGYFSPSIELFSGSSAASPYLLGPEKEPQGPKSFFVLMKVYRGIPFYYYYIPPAIKPEDDDLHEALKQLLKHAATDFDSIKNGNVARKTKDTLVLNGHTAFINYKGGHRTASLVFPSDSASFTDQWNRLQTSLQAALGSSYVYHHYSLVNKKYVAYFVANQYGSQPAVRLQEEWASNRRLIILNIESPISHPVKRGYNFKEE